MLREHGRNFKPLGQRFRSGLPRGWEEDTTNHMRAETYKPYSYCSFCGTPFPSEVGWPRPCAHCGRVTYRNPLPVGVLIQPVQRRSGERAVVLVRRAIEPRRGELALPGGFLEVGETWQAGAARELWEETGLTAVVAGIEIFQVHTAPDAHSTLLLFGVAPLLHEADLPPFRPSAEVDEVVFTAVVPPQGLAFPLHTEALQAYLGHQS